MIPVHEATLRNVWVETKNHIGSGVMIRDNLVLTNFHMADVDSTVSVNDKEAEILAVDPLHDLMLLRVPLSVHLPPIRISTKVRVTEEVFYLGNTNQHRDYTSFGRITFMDGKYLYSDTTAVEGSSGGGLYNKRGELLGLNDGHEFHVIMFHVPAADILRFLEAHKELLQ